MIKDSSRASESKGLRQPIQPRGTLQSLMRPVAGAILALGIAATICSADEQHSHVDAQSREGVASPQTECPVMIGNEIDPSIYSDYQGKRVFFCCQSCKAAFAKAPERYLSRLPQFAAVQAGASHEEHASANHANEF